MTTDPTAKWLRKINPHMVNILIVEDNDPSRRMICELLRGAGFTRLIQARSAEEAIGHIEAHAPDLMITDWGLPGISGLELVSTLRHAAMLPDPRFPEPKMPVIMLTARQRSKDVTEARNAGVDEFLIKPFSTSGLIRAVVAALTQSRPFVISATYIGPCRRRRSSEAYKGIMKRSDDIEQAAEDHFRTIYQDTLSVELEGLRSLMQARGGLHRETLNYMVTRLLDTEKRANEFRLKFVAEATLSLNDYMRNFGLDADPEVLDVHLDSIKRLNALRNEDVQDAAVIIKQLHSLVSKRKRNKRLSA
jgi:CheY-like chemotaxis protein